MKYTGIFRKTILVAAIAAAFASPAQAATPISGNYSGVGSTFLSGNHTLTSGNLNLDNGHTLVIEPGAS
ncbi:MAG: hypothetical protein KGZ80_08300, partial [Methylomonas sp.]|nr:hypothetical protein [Methylomonas sp.]